MSRLPRLPEGVISSINSYNSTTYPNNVVSIGFFYNDDSDEGDETSDFSCNITIDWNANIGAYWRHLVYRYPGWINELFDQSGYVGEDTKRIEINNKLRTFPNYQTIFGDDLERVGLKYINTTFSDENAMRLNLSFAYIKEENEEEEDTFNYVDFDSDRGRSMREAATFLTAHTVVETMKYLIRVPDTPPQDYLTIEEYGGNRILINQKGEEFGEFGENIITNTYLDRRNDYKLLQNDQRIYSFDFWSDHIDTTPRDYIRQLLLSRASRETRTSFTLVDNKRLPLSSGKEGATMAQLKF